MDSLLRVWKVEVPDSNPAMGSTWEITPYSQFMLISTLDGVECTVMTHPDSLLPQAWTHQVECHYDHAQVEDANSGCSILPNFL